MKKEELIGEVITSILHTPDVEVGLKLQNVDIKEQHSFIVTLTLIWQWNNHNKLNGVN